MNISQVMMKQLGRISYSKVRKVINPFVVTFCILDINSSLIKIGVHIVNCVFQRSAHA